MEIKSYKPIDHKIKAVVYGSSGCGKTVFGGTAPKPIFASAEGGLLSIADKNPAFVEIKSLKDLSDLLDYLKTQKHDFETVIIDSISEINEIIKIEIEKKNGRSMQIQDWGDLSKKIKAIFRGFRDLPMHVLFIAQETMDKDEDKIEKIVPSLNGKAATEIAYFMDIVGYLYIDKTTGDRKMITLPSSKLLTKDRSGTIGNEAEADFSGRVEKVKKIKIGEQEVLATHERKKENEDIEIKGQDKPKTPPKAKEEPITEKTKKQVFAVWKNLWKLSMEKLPTDEDENGNFKYTSENEEPSRKHAMKSVFGVESSKDLTEKQAKEFILRCDNRITELKKIPTPPKK